MAQKSTHRETLDWIQERLGPDYKVLSSDYQTTKQHIKIKHFDHIWEPLLRNLIGPKIHFCGVCKYPVKSKSPNQSNGLLSDFNAINFKAIPHKPDEYQCRRCGTIIVKKVKDRTKRIICDNCDSRCSSFGEELIWTLLTFNNIPFRQEVPVLINEKMHRFDFYLPNQHVIIEYDGKQHFLNSDNFYWRKDGHQRDMEKDQWCIEKGFTLLRIPYTNRSFHSIIKHIQPYVDNELSIPTQGSKTLSRIQRQQDIVVYANTHTIKETMSKFHISHTTITRYKHNISGNQPRKCLTIEQKREIYTYYKSHSLQETMSKFHISHTTIARIQHAFN